MQENDINITQGDQKSYNLAFTDANGGAIDITGSIITMTAKSDLSGDEVISKDAVITSGVGGTATITLTTAETNISLGSYFYDIQISGGVLPVTTVIKGRLNITWQVTE